MRHIEGGTVENPQRTEDSTRLLWNTEVLLPDPLAPPRRVRVLIPRTMLPFNGATATTATPTATNAFVGLVQILAPIIADRITYRPTANGSDPAVVRLALYNEDGTRRLINVTDGVDDAGSADRSVTFPRTHLKIGNYYIFACLSSGATSPPIITYNTADSLSTGASGELDLEGHITVTGGVAPETFDPTSITGAADETIAFRLDSSV